MELFERMNALAGWTACRVSGAMPAAFLNQCAGKGISPLSVQAEGDFALLVRLHNRDVKKAVRLARKTQCSLEVCYTGGAPSFWRTLRRRGLAFVGLLGIFCLLAWSKLYIWDITVTGNETVSTGRILDALRECGVAPGSFWPGFTSDNLRSQLLIELPELSWATVNIYGSRAEVIVRERIPKPTIWRDSDNVDIIAGKTGYITRVLALNGTALVRSGSAVMAGETLIAGWADSAYGGRRVVHAVGDVRAETYYELTAQIPLTVKEKIYTGEKASRYALIVGKNRYNFYRNSSISDGVCDRITEEWNFHVGEFFSLPISLVRTQSLTYTLAEQTRDQNMASRLLESALTQRLRQTIGDEGEMISQFFTASVGQGRITVCLRAKCVEQIGVELFHPQEELMRGYE